MDPDLSRADATSHPQDPRPVAVVTGGEGTLGRALKVALGSAGYVVHAPGRRVLDVTNADQVWAFFSALDHCDLLVANAAIGEAALIGKMDGTFWDRVAGVTLDGAMRCAREAGRVMTRDRGGHVIFVGSHAGHHGAAGLASYAAAKAALVGLARSLAREWGEAGVRVNVVLPGWMETAMTRGVPDRVVAAALADHVLGRFTTVHEAAAFIAFLAGTRHISGQVLQIDSRPDPGM